MTSAIFAAAEVPRTVGWLVLADGMHLSDGLEAALGESAKMKGSCGFVVKLPDQTVGVKKEKGYVGIEGDGWPVDLPDMPTIDVRG